ncbi:MAG: phosphoglycerate mutase family protein [Chloroflexi bacterium]|nr:MAG: phosphoglycerate mutase family protein [Chloroflexota bacterium]
MPMKEVWLIRHAESAANAGLPGSDPALTPLTEKGCQQAAKVSTVIPTIPSLIVVSPYIRTQQTARLTMQLFPEVECQEWDIQEFTYLSPILCENTTSRQRRPMVEEYWKRNDPLYVHGEGAESFLNFHKRVCDMHQRIERIDRGLILIFGHGQFMRLFLLCLLLRAFEPVPDLMQKFSLFNQLYEIPNCGILKMRFQDQEPFISGLALP